MARISVIVPMFRSENFLAKCLESILQSTYSDIEILCVDDFSPDRSFEIASSYADRDSRIRLIRHENNRGLGGARNTGISAATGDYIAGVDSDDWIDPSMLERLMSATEGGRVDIVECGFFHLDSSGNVLAHYSPKEQRIDDPSGLKDIFTVTKLAFWNKLWRKDLFQESGVGFPENTYFEDVATTPRLVAHAKCVRFVSSALYYYLKRDGSITYSASDKHQADYFRCFDILFDFLEGSQMIKSYLPGFREFIEGNIDYHKYVVNHLPIPYDRKSEYVRRLVAAEKKYLLRLSDLKS